MGRLQGYHPPFESVIISPGCVDRDPGKYNFVSRNVVLFVCTRLNVGVVYIKCGWSFEVSPIVM